MSVLLCDSSSNSRQDMHLQKCICVQACVCVYTELVECGHDHDIAIAIGSPPSEPLCVDVRRMLRASVRVRVSER